MIDAKNKPLQQVTDKISTRRTLLANRTAKRKAEEATRSQANLVKGTALKARHIRTRRTSQPPDMEGSGIQLVPDPLSPESTLEFPTVFLYPMHAQSDFVKAVSETHSLLDHLSYLFPLPWDEERREYTPSGVECFMDTVSGGLVKVGKKLPLLKILAGGKVEVVDELVRIYVVPVPLVGRFVGEMKARKSNSKSSSTTAGS